VSVSLSDVLNDKREFWYFWVKARTGKSRKVHISYGYKRDDLQKEIVSWGICGSMMDSDGFDIVDFPEESDICKRCFKSDHPSVQGLLRQYQTAKTIQRVEVENMRP